MVILTYAGYNFLRHMRDKKALSLMLILPIVIIFILGNALHSTFEGKSTGKTQIAYLNNDNGPESRQFDNMLKSRDISELLSVSYVFTEDQGINMVKSKKAAALIKLSSDFSSNIQSRKDAYIEIFTGNDKLRSSVVRSVVDGYANMTNSVITLMEMGSKNPFVQISSGSNIIDRPVSSTGKIPGAMDYYAVTMLVLILMYGSAYSIHGIGEDFLEAMSGRLRCTPVRLYKQFIGKMLGIVILLVLQAGVVILFTKYVYNANWGSDIFGVFSIVVTLAMFITTLGGMLCLLLKNRMVANALINTIIPVTTFLAGGYIYIPSSGGRFNIIRELLPNSLAQNALFSVIYKSPFVQQDFLKGVLSQFQLSMISLWGMIAVMLIVVSLAGKRRLA